MIRRVAQTLQLGMAVVRTHTELLFALALDVVVPAILLYVVSSTLEAATANAVSAEKQRVGALHDVLEVALTEQFSYDAFASLLQTLKEEQVDITKAQLVTETADALVVTVAIGDALSAGTVLDSETARSYKSADARPGDSFIYEFYINGERTWQVFRSLGGGGEARYLFTEHRLAGLDARMESRSQSVYLVFAVTFIILIAFAYWMARQIDYRARYQRVLGTLKERDAMTSSVVHELRAPLTAIRGYASMVEESPDTPTPVRAYGEQIKTSSARLVALIGDYLDLMRLLSGAQKPTLAPESVRTVLEAVVKEQTPAAHEHHLTLSLAPGNDQIVLGNSKHLTQIFTNLVSNAIKYTPQGHVEVTLGDDGREVEVRIKDTGTGMSAADQAKLFAPFTRVGGVEGGAVTGTGLGMWITKLMVEQLGGTIGVESIKGIGTHVVVRFKKVKK